MKILITLALATVLAFIACAIQILSCNHTGLVIGLMGLAVVLIMICDRLCEEER